MVNVVSGSQCVLGGRPYTPGVPHVPPRQRLGLCVTEGDCQAGDQLPGSATSLQGAWQETQRSVKCAPSVGLSNHNL